MVRTHTDNQDGLVELVVSAETETLEPNKSDGAVLTTVASLEAAMPRNGLITVWLLLVDMLAACDLAVVRLFIII
jgi:hypothetical protein